MQVNAYANLTTQKLTPLASGATSLTFPVLVQGDTLRMGLRFSELIEGAAIETPKTVVSLKASIGYLDARPTSGSFVLRTGAGPYVEGDNQTVALAFDGSAAAMVAALVDIGLTDAAVELRDGSWIVSNDGAAITDFQGASADGNLALFPSSMVRVREIEIGGLYSYDVRLIQTPLASTSSFETIVPPAPTITEVQAGGTSGTTVWPEIQALHLQPAFRGVYQLRRGFKRTGELSVEDGPEEIQAALEALADDDGSFTVTNPATNIAHITFNGSMAGSDQDLLEVDVFSAPAGDATFVLDLSTAELTAALRTAATIKPTLEIEVVLEDDNNPSIHYTHTICREVVSVTRELNWTGLEVAAGIDWLRPPYGRSYVPFTTDQIINGTRNYVAPFGDGLAFTFEIAHNLDSLDYLAPAIIDNSNGALLTQGVDYTVDAADANTITITTLAGTAWPTDGLKIVLGLVGPSSAFQAHNHTIAQVDGLQTILDDLGTRMGSLEDLLPTFSAQETAAAKASVVSSWVLPSIFEVFPSRLAIDAKDVPSINVDDLPRAGGLLPACYFTGTPTNVTELPGSPDDTIVYKNTDTAAIALPGYLGRRSSSVEPDGFFAYDGRGFYQVEKVVTGDNVYYPTDFVRELFRIPVSEKQLRLGKALTLDLSAIFAVFKTNVSAQWALVIDIGIPSAEGSASPNLFDVEFLPPSLDQTFVISPVPSSHNFGLRITRVLVDSVDTISVDRVLYGSMEATDTGESITSANFIVRGRLHRFDTQDNETDPRGLVAFNGLAATIADADGVEYGVATIQ